ncbi:MAG: HIT domain-containing protein [Candidatus Omnitrophica bacterium]|nr:HIT domain-containing protein [Candidatus Omnitrophota bacterium]
MNRLWAPWRKAYITHKVKIKGCLFCNALRCQNDKSNLVVRRTRHSFAMLNLYPYNNGHVMIVPARHVDDLDKLNEAELLDLTQLLIHVKKLLNQTMKPEGFNIGINLGKAAGAGITSHVHIHIVPRWVGDVNFMPALSSTKIISDSLQSSYEQLTQAHQKTSRGKRR